MRHAVLALAVAFIVACSSANPPTASGSAGTVAKPAINEQTRGQIQAVLQKQHDTNATRDNNGMLSTIDPDALPLRRCANEAFDIASRQGVGNVPQVMKIDAYLDTYVRAYVQEGGNGQRRLFFKQLSNGTWVQTEPKESELGGEKKMTVGDIELAYWGVDQDVADALAKGSTAAKDVVLKNLLSTDRRDPLSVRFYPTRAIAGVVGCFVAGYHLTNVASDPYIRIVRYWFDASGQLSPTSVGIISHEWLHWAQDQFSAGVVARLPWWLAEGWPDYVGIARSASTNQAVLCQTKTPTLKQLEDGADPNGPAEDQVNYYSFANTMVEYLYKTYGGADAYRKLLVAFKEDARPTIAMPKAIGVTPDAFYTAWLASAKKQYC